MKKRTQLSLLLVLLSGCSSPSNPQAARTPIAETNDSLLAVLASLAAPEDSRIAADAKIAVRPDASEARLAVLEQIVYASGHSDTMRIYAIDQLAEADSARTGKLLALYLPRMDSRPVIEHVCQVAVQLGDPRLVDSLIRSYDRFRRYDDGAKAPQIKAIETLAGKTLVEALKDRLIFSRDTSVRVAAMDSLAATQGEAFTRRILAEKYSTADAFLQDLQWYVSTFEHVPSGSQETSWARQLRRPEYQDTVTRAIEIHRSFKREKDYEFAPRLIHALASADSLTLRMSRAELEDIISTRLSALTHAKRVPSYEKAPDDRNESFEANKSALSRGDLIVIKMLLAILSDPGFCRQVHTLGLEDLSDTTTEHGGMLLYQNGRGQAVIYPPMYPANDQAYIASDKLMAAILNGLAPFHFHYHQIYNGDFAGPGMGDLEFVKNNATHSVIITSLGPREFNVDYVTPNRAVVDLGVYKSE